MKRSWTIALMAVILALGAVIAAFFAGKAWDDDLYDPDRDPDSDPDDQDKKEKSDGKE